MALPPPGPPAHRKNMSLGVVAMRAMPLVIEETSLTVTQVGSESGHLAIPVRTAETRLGPAATISTPTASFGGSIAFAEAARAFADAVAAALGATVADDPTGASEGFSLHPAASHNESPMSHFIVECWDRVRPMGWRLTIADASTGWIHDRVFSRALRNRSEEATIAQTTQATPREVSASSSGVATRQEQPLCSG